MTEELRTRLLGVIGKLRDQRGTISAEQLFEEDSLAFVFDHYWPDTEAPEAAIREAFGKVTAPAPSPQKHKQEQSTTPPRSENRRVEADAPPVRRDRNFPKPPFRFVAIDDEVFLPGAPGDLDRPLADGLSATLTVQWRIETPLLIGETKNGQVHPLTMSVSGTDWIIPGASLRGMIRSVVEIAARGRLRPFNRDFRYKDQLALGHRLPVGHRMALDGNGKWQHPDLVETLFGYVNEAEDYGRAERAGGDTLKPADHARRGRIRFGFATTADPAVLKSRRAVLGIQGEPKPSFGPFYLKGEKTHAAPAAAAGLAGRKRYLPRFPGAQTMAAAIPAVEQAFCETATAKTRAADLTSSELCFLTPKDAKSAMEFSSEIRMTNVSPVELGAVLWALTFGRGWDDAGPCPQRHLLGRARPFGAGQTAVASVSGTIRMNASPERAAALRVRYDFPVGAPVRSEGAGVEKCRDAFKAFTKAMGGADWARSAPVVELLEASDPATNEGMNPRYPTLKEYGEIKNHPLWASDRLLKP